MFKKASSGILIFFASLLITQALYANQFLITHFDEPFIVSKHSYISDEIILERYDERCIKATGNSTTLDKSKAVTEIHSFSVQVKAYDLSFLRCEKWTNEWELGVIALGSGGNDWAVTIGEQFIVRVRAISLAVTALHPQELVISAKVHPTYCQNASTECLKRFKLSLSD